jgi:hypothetical protein
MPLTWDPPIIPPPDYLIASSSLGSITNSCTITTSGKYSNINLGNGNIITIDGNVELYVTGNVILGNDAEIRIVDLAANPNASLTLYLGANFEGKNGSCINNLTMDAHRLSIYGLENCTKIWLFAKDTFYGTIYAPNANIVLKNAVEYFGALVGKSFLQNESADFHYDASLRKVSISDLGVRFVIRRWQE